MYFNRCKIRGPMGPKSCVSPVYVHTTWPRANKFDVVTHMGSIGCFKESSIIIFLEDEKQYLKRLLNATKSTFLQHYE